MFCDFKESEGYSEKVEESEIGLVVNPGKKQDVRNNIKRVKQEPRIKDYSVS